MNQRALLFAALFLLLAAGALATPFITVDKSLMICNKNKCENATTVRNGLMSMPAPMTTGIRSIHVKDQPPRNVSGRLHYTQSTADGRITIYARGMNTTRYRATVENIVRWYYNEQAMYDAQWDFQQSVRKYPLPSWAPRPGQCDLGTRMTTTMGRTVCVRPRRH